MYKIGHLPHWPPHFTWGFYVLLFSNYWHEWNKGKSSEWSWMYLLPISYDKPTDLLQHATTPTSSGAGRGMLSKQLQHGLRKPKPLVPIGRGKMLLKVLEESSRKGQVMGNIDTPIRTIMPAVSTASDRADETVILKSMSKQANRSSSSENSSCISWSWCESSSM